MARGSQEGSSDERVGAPALKPQALALAHGAELGRALQKGRPDA
jgi:hypothetical protein